MNDSYSLSMRNPMLYANPIYNNYNVSNPTTRVTLEQQNYQQPLPNQNVSDPYSDYVTTINSLSDVSREKLCNDERYIQAYAQCKNAIEQTLYARIIPEIIQTQQGRILFEQLYNTTKNLKEEYTQLDIQREKEAADLEKRLSEREKSLAEKERKIDEMLNKINIAQSSQSQQAPKQSQQNHSRPNNQNKYTPNQSTQDQSSNQGYSNDKPNIGGNVE